MAGFFLPDSRMEMPELLIPGQKPIGSVKIDWSHPLTDLLMVCSPGGDGERNLVPGGNQVTRVGNITTGVASGIQGTAYTGSSSDYTSISNANGVLNLTQSGKRTYMAHVWVNRTADSQVIIGQRSGTTERVVFRQNGSSAGAPNTFNFFAYAGTASTAVSGAPLPNNIIPSSGCLATVIYSADYSTNTLYGTGKVNGIIYNSSNTGGTTGASSTNTGNILTLDGTIEPFAGTIFFRCVWDRHLGLPERLSLVNNPYQFLIPS